MLKVWQCLDCCPFLPVHNNILIEVQDHGWAAVSHKICHSFDVHAASDQLSGESVPQVIRTNASRDAGPAQCGKPCRLDLVDLLPLVVDEIGDIRRGVFLPPLPKQRQQVLSYRNFPPRGVEVLLCPVDAQDATVNV